MSASSWQKGRNDGPIRRVPYTLRRRVHWGDSDTAQIAYTSKFVDFAIEAAEYWWESVLDVDWYLLNVDRNTGTPMVSLKFDFESPLIAGDRVDLAVFLQRLGTSSLTLRVEGTKIGGHRAFTAELTSALIDRAAMKAKPFPEAWRQRIEGYARECQLSQKGVVSSDVVLDFWFGAPSSPEHGTHRAIWFGKDESISRNDFDAEIRDKFEATYHAAATGELDHWCESCEGTLALILVLDQFSRNMFRDDPRAFAADNKALAIAKHALDKNYDKDCDQVVRKFFYLPLEHSEDLADQEHCLELFRNDAGNDEGEKNLQYAQQHYDVIARFGRFPHRNATLGRDSTDEELAFLEEPNSRF